MKSDKYYDIAIVDSGVNFNDSKYVGYNLEGFSFVEQNGTIIKSSDYCDLIGHGTAVFDIIHKNSPSAKICNVKVFDDKMSVDEERLEYVLEYIYNNVHCKILNLSLGICRCQNYKRLEDICKKLSLKNTIIVAAFDNEGSFSFPAAFDCVIGVDSNYQCESPMEWEFVEGSPINVRAKGGLQRLRWNNEKTIITGGSSFACAYITSYIFHLTKEFGPDLSLGEALNHLKEKAKNIYPAKRNKSSLNRGMPFKINRAAIFPFNKEMHQIVRFSNTLSFELSKIYDIRYSGRVGTHTNQIIVPSQMDLGIDYVIMDVNDINFSEFDTLILGHLGEINRMLGYDIREDIMKKAEKYGVNIYSFDYIHRTKEASDMMRDAKEFFSPHIDAQDVPYNTFDKLYEITKPVIGIWGTSSSQGKFTLQIILMLLFKEAGYSVGTIGSEPHSLLFEMDYVYPIGYASAVFIDTWQSITILNKMLFQLCDRDVIITGSQANTIPMNMANISQYPIRQHGFLLGTNPDIVILCVNADDEIEYIRNTIKYIEGTVNSKVIGLVVYPMKQTADWRNIFGAKVRIHDSEYLHISEAMSLETSLPVFQLGVQEDMNALLSHIINYLLQ